MATLNYWSVILGKKGVLLSGLMLKWEFLKVNDRRGEFSSQEEGISSQCCPVWMGGTASPWWDTFCHSLNDPVSLWHHSHHFPPRLLSSHTGLCAGRNALSLDVGMAGSFLSFWSQPKISFPRTSWLPGKFKRSSLSANNHFPSAIFSLPVDLINNRHYHV